MNVDVSSRKVKCCFICGGEELIALFELGDQPMSGIFPLLDEVDPVKAPLGLERCETIINGIKCGNVQMSHIANFENMYGMSYGYNSSLSPFMISHLKNISENVKKYVQIDSDDWILDIGCNDGSLLLNFMDQTRNMVGVDPSAGKFVSQISQNIELFVDYFPSTECTNFMNGKKFKSITSIAMFYDLAEPRKFISEIYKHLSDDGIWTVELAEFNEFLKNLSYDQICHEHLLYLDNRQMVDLARDAGFYLIDITYSEINGGSACYYFSKEKSREITPELSRVNRDQVSQLSRRIRHNKKNVMDYLRLLLDSGKTIYGYGASTKGNVLGNYYGLNNSMLPYISDINPFKHNRRTPGTNIPIISHVQMRLDAPDFLFSFIWHLRKEVLLDEKEYILSGGKIIFPLPRLHVVDSDNYFDILEANLQDEAFDISTQFLIN